MLVKIGLILLIPVILVVGVFAYLQYRNLNGRTDNIPEAIFNESAGTTPSETDPNAPLVSTVATNLDTPWGLVFLPDGSLLLTERSGNVRLIDSNGNLISQPVATISQVKEVGEGGLLGITLHPNFETNNFVYLYYTYSSTGENTLNRVVRMTYNNGTLSDEQIIVDNIPGASNHNGGRIKFGPDQMLYITTGDAGNPSQSQDRNSLAGKILRVTDDGKPAPDNQFQNRTYSYGHRNSQGITWDEEGRLWSTEHGRSGAQSGLDELNLIEIGNNYGWPTIQGTETQVGMVAPVLNSGSETWAPGGAAYSDGSVYFTGLRGRGLYKAKISGNSADLTKHFDGEFGRLRDVIVGPDGMLYVATSNRDGRGSPADQDDMILRVNPTKL